MAGLTWLPFTDERYTAVVGRPADEKRCRRSRRWHRTDLADALVGVGTFSVDSRGRFPGRYRMAVLENLSRVSSRLRMHGSTGIDLAYVADGILGGAISFGGHVWDHAAGVALVRAAGGVVTDLAGATVDADIAVRAGRQRPARTPRSSRSCAAQADRRITEMYPTTASPCG